MPEQPEDLWDEVSHSFVAGGIVLAAWSTILEWARILFAHAEPSGWLGVIGLWLFGIGSIIRFRRHDDRHY